MSEAKIAYATFKPSNNIAYGQDMQFWRDLPPGVRFRIESLGVARWRLIAPGYGEPGAYGNGAIYVSLSQPRKPVP